MTIPTIETERLVLRGFVPTDAERLTAILANPRVMRYLPGSSPVPRARVEAALETIAKHWDLHGYGRWAVVPKADGQLAGWCGLEYLNEIGETEVLYLFDEPYWGQGIATEAARASVRFGFEALPLERIIALAVPENVASRRVMEKLGLAYVQALQLWDLDLVQYAVERQVWHALQGRAAGSPPGAR